jgi:hypothetical protein
MDMDKKVIRERRLAHVDRNEKHVMERGLGSKAEMIMV